jgi:hypothetical protein
MTKAKRASGRLVTGAGGVLLILSLVLPWAGAGRIDRSMARPTSSAWLQQSS